MATIPLSPELVGYIAGIIDGEGSFYVVRSESRRFSNGYRMMPRLIIVNTYRPLLEYLQSFIGGNLQERNEKRPNCKPCWYLALSSNSLRQLLPVIRKYLIVKRKHCELILEYLQIANSPLPYRYKDPKQVARLLEIHKEIQELNK